MVVVIFVADFDNTVMDTFAPSPNGIGVEKAYRLACRRVFGLVDDTLFNEIGGLQNRAPGEFANELIKAGSSLPLVENALDFLAREKQNLLDVVPPGKGASLDYNADDPMPAVIEAFVRDKIRFFLPEVGAPYPDGRIYPEPCRGFMEFHREMTKLRENGGQGKPHFAIVSSGHDKGIEKCLQVWNLPPSDLMVTDDDMRSPECHLRPNVKAKPQAGPYVVLRRKWRDKFGESILHNRVLYVGDSVVSDGGFAKNIGAPFVWINPEHLTTCYDGTILSIRDWRELLPLLDTTVLEALDKGLTMTEVLKIVFDSDLQLK